MNLAAVFRLIQRRIAVRAQKHVHTDHAFFLNRVDWRVGYLRKELLEIMEQRLRTLGEHRNRRIVPHGTDRIKPRQRNRQNGEHAVFVCPAENVLQFCRVTTCCALSLIVRFVKLDHFLLEPLLPRTVKVLILDLLVF